ncbi:hypothetical protein F5X68DRAFT_199163 [Plectosphaerella plurivora]|uniref:Uncharacterized protein n=1 Tax=Plectosphaerella plurivora TaxID=936078 RepID=A0A9P9AEI4_9PEZI|nr:hypothetical protein F5X68DRAFT_199163 [Plectosphaerella plurivora]
MMHSTAVYESPWARDKRYVSLHQPAVDHLRVAEIFLKLLPFLPSDKNGEVTDEALAYSEWRYISYLRFLDVQGAAPCDYPPPWDVALIWYLHLLSPTRFQRHIWNSRSMQDGTFYGLEHRHFPFSVLVQSEWLPEKTVRAWDRWSSLSTGSRPGPNLSYQLWPSPPWEPDEVPRRRSGIFSSIFRRDKVPQPPPLQQSQLEFNRSVIMQDWNRCSLGTVNDLPATWDIKSYTEFRTWRRFERCRIQSQHEAFRQQCELTPWPSIDDLRADLNRQIPFWKVLTEVSTTQPLFVQGIEDAIDDYTSFIGLFHGNMVRRLQYISKFDPKPPVPKSSTTAPGSRFIALAPPTLEVDLLWHTHRMFPAKYWLWSSGQAGWLVEHQVQTKDAAAYALKRTRQEWERRLKASCPGRNSLHQWLHDYVPDAARYAAEDCETTDLKHIILGHHAWRNRKYNPYRDTWDSSGTTGGGGSGDGGGSSGGGGCGGGDGGGGGGGGGGE